MTNYGQKHVHDDNSILDYFSKVGRFLYEEKPAMLRLISYFRFDLTFHQLFGFVFACSTRYDTYGYI